MFYWEAKRGLDLLTRFRQKVVDYENNAQWNDYDNEYDENAQATTLRQEINQDMPEVTTAIQKVGQSTIVHYSGQRFEGNVDVLSNFFRLPGLDMNTVELLDRLDRTIGAYRYAVSYLWRQMFNPFYWIGICLALIGSVPFRVLRLAGFNIERAEASLPGKLTKSLISFLTLTYFLLAILEKLDLLAPVVAAIKRLRNLL